MSDPQRDHVQQESNPRRWRLRVCPCGIVSVESEECAGFPGAWNEEKSDFDRVACLAEWVDVVEEQKTP